MIKWIKKFFFITNEKVVNENSLKNKSLEELITLKDEEHDFLSINIPMIISGFWIMISAILSMNPKIWEQYPQVPKCISWILIWFIIRMYIILRNITKEREIIKQNLKIYDKEIFKRLRQYKKDDDEYKEKITDILDEIRKNTKSK